MKRSSKCLVTVLALTLSVASCGGGSQSPTPSSPTGSSPGSSSTSPYSIGGTVSGLSGQNLVLQNNRGDPLELNFNGPFTFDTAMTPGTAYSVTVATQPVHPTQSCSVTNGSGTANANVTGIQVNCVTLTFTISGSVSGLSGTGLVLQDNGGDNLPISADGTFTFATPLDFEIPYAVSVAVQPSNPIQGCGVTNGVGVATANVTNVQVACTNGNHNEWTWVNGNARSSFGVEGVPATTNVPGALESATGWAETNGSLWFYGGNLGSGEFATALWRYSTSEWTWMSGSQSFNQYGIYGTLGTAAPANYPGSRAGAVTWVDTSGNLWLFGGLSYNEIKTRNASLNDLWMYSVASGEWTWIGGSNQYDQAGIYGTLGVSDPNNIPGARSFPVTWTDSTGNFWMFGGNGIDSTGIGGDLNDLWEYSAGEWTWMGGSNLANQAGVYGVEGTASPTNIPPPRDSAVAWTDTSGNVWLFGGETTYATGQASHFDLNDLWEYGGGEWTWVGGSDQPNQAGVYGVQGTAGPGNIPGARDSAVGWIDATGNLWLLGGEDVSTNNYNDLWKYSAGQWTWINGSDICCQAGIYGTEGTGAPSNTPGARYGAVSWIDSSGNLWLFGGSGTGANGIGGELNDLWEYRP